MAWWKKPNNTMVASIAEAAAAGLPFFEAPITTTTTPAPELTVNTVSPEDDDSSQLDLWFTATNDKVACGHFTQVSHTDSIKINRPGYNICMY